MRLTHLLLVPVLLGGMAAPVPAPAAAPASAPPVSTLTGIRVAHHPGFDRIVFDFTGPVPETHRVRYVDEVISSGSGKSVRVAGRTRLEVVLSPADAHDADGATTRGRTAYALPNVLTTVRASDFEAVLTYGVGLARRTPFTVFTLQDPSRVVIDVKAAFPTSRHRVFLFNRDNYLDNDEPFFTAVQRTTPRARPFVGVLDRLYAGPLPAERNRGLRLLRSRSTGFADLTIEDGIARVRLTGRCSSGGSTVTVAGSIIPTLKQFPKVNWVKIYGPAGHTLTPTGESDSVPACLEP